MAIVLAGVKVVKGRVSFDKAVGHCKIAGSIAFYSPTELKNRRPATIRGRTLVD
jgi:hypothetical protein